MTVDRDWPGGATSRRGFLARAGAAATAGLALAGGTRTDEQPGELPTDLPTIQLGPHRVTRLVAGWNPVGGHSHTTLDMARHMTEYFTDERTVEFILNCQKAGINTWQISPGEKAARVVKLMRQKGARVKLICLHGDQGLRGDVKEVIDEYQPIAMVHHGGVTDALFRAGKAQVVRDYVKKVRDHGLLAGVSAHNPENIKRIAEEGWEVDLFMTCFYYVTRPREDQQQLGKVTIGEPFFESDPDDMTKVIRQVKQPCLGFKILAAGRKCWTSFSVKQAFQYAFENIKPTDGVIVGMYPRFFDEVTANAEYAKQLGAAR